MIRHAEDPRLRAASTYWISFTTSAWDRMIRMP
jgi:hypothetical protein